MSYFLNQIKNPTNTPTLNEMIVGTTLHIPYTMGTETDGQENDNLTTIGGASNGALSVSTTLTKSTMKSRPSVSSLTDKQVLIKLYARNVYFYMEKFVTNRVVLSSHDPKDPSDEQTGSVRLAMMDWIKKQSAQDGTTAPEEFIMTEKMQNVFCQALNQKRGDVNNSVKAKIMGKHPEQHISLVHCWFLIDFLFYEICMILLCFTLQLGLTRMKRKTVLGCVHLWRTFWKCDVIFLFISGYAMTLCV
jgi:hypothetical protein